MVPANGKLKAWSQVFAGVLAALIPFLVDHKLDGVEITNAVLIFLAGLRIYIVPNLTATVGKYAKGAVAVGAAVGTLLVSLLADGSYALDSGEVIQLVLAGLGAVGVFGFSAPQHEPAQVAPVRAA
jgi:hypothetical protein